jgi:hypothetical protein
MVAYQGAKLAKLSDDLSESWLRRMLREANAELGEMPDKEVTDRAAKAVKRVTQNLTAIKAGKIVPAHGVDRYVRGTFLNVMRSGE